MNPATLDLLRAATIQALQSKEDVAAVELLALMNTETKPVTATPVLPPAVTSVIDGPAHDYHYWARFVREKFIPFITNNGRVRFTSHELLSWLENNSELALTSGDIEEQSSTGRLVWKNSLTNGLASLKKQGVLKAESFGKDYEICKALPPIQRPRVLDSFRRLG